MKKSVLSILLVGAMAMAAMTGCSSTTAQTVEPATSTEAATEAKVAETTIAAATEVTVTHSKGVTVVPLNPKKAAVFDMGILDTIDALSVDVELGVPQGNIPSYLSKYEAAVNLGSVKEADMEAVVAFEPDVIFISGRLSDYYDELNKIAPTVFVDLAADAYMEDFAANTTMVAEIFGKTDKVDSLLAAIDTKVEEAKAIAAEKDLSALIILTNDGSISAYGSGSRFGLIHDVIGMKTADENIEVSTHGQEANFEYIAQINPDVLFVVDRAVITGGSTMASATLDNDLVNGTEAAKNDKIVYLTPEYWYLSGGGVTSVGAMIDEVVAAIK